MYSRAVLLILLFCGYRISAQPVTLFQKGEAGYQCFRIPAIVRTPSGTLLAFAEGRINNCGDFGDVDIVMKRSHDQGKTWDELRVVAQNDTLQAGNPAPVFDLTDPRYPQGRLFLVYNTGNASEQHNREGKGVREVLYMTSVDAGATWSVPTNITKSVHRPFNPAYNPKYIAKEDWRSYANTPGHALQLTRGRHRGRLLIPANHSAGPPQKNFKDYRAHAFYSDDHGKTWKLSSVLDYPGSNESTAAQLSDGRVLINMRDQSGSRKYRLLAESTNGGKTWSPVRVETQLPDPVCEGSMLEVTGPDGKTAILFSNLDSQTKRENLTVYQSLDDARSWQKIKVVETGSAAYSDLVQLTDSTLGILYESENYSKIIFATFEVAF
ncbi:MAG: glycoside hydrolase [Bacteroidetes bacterium]|nr:glycoside hydrolase [Bacteroidota bacterium]